MGNFESKNIGNEYEITKLNEQKAEEAKIEIKKLNEKFEEVIKASKKLVEESKEEKKEPDDLAI